MGSKISLPLENDEIVSLQEETEFSKSQIQDLYGRFLQLSREGGEQLFRSDLIRMSELKSNPLGSRIVETFFKDACGDEEAMDFTQFVKAASVFKPHRKCMRQSAVNSKELKMRFLFNIYDLDGDETISLEEMLSLLRMLVGSEVTKEMLQQIASRALLEGDQDQDGFIGFEDFKKVLSNIETNNIISIRFLE